jgi:hypothetical protein
VEALFFPHCKVGDEVYAKLTDTPCKGWSQLQTWVHSWGVANAWPNGRPESCTRNEEIWETKSGWYPHKAVPENDHTDPLSWPAFVSTAPKPAPKPAPVPAPQPTYEPFPGASFFRPGRRSPIIAAMHKRLVAVGCDRYQSSANADLWGEGDRRSYAAWQHKLGYTGAAADGYPGAKSWAALRVPNV